MNILIAGYSGFLGGRIREFYKKKNFSVFDYKKKIPKKIDYIINVAGPDHHYCKKFPKKSKSIRLNINKKLNKLIEKKNVKKIIYISSIHVYEKKKFIDESSNLNSKNSYGNSHIESEKYVLNNFKNVEERLILRVSNCFGFPTNIKSNSWSLVINNVVKNIFKNNEIKINSKENFYRDFLGVSTLLKTINYFICNKSNQNIINICSGNSISIKKICLKIKKNYEDLFFKKIRIISNFKKLGIKSTIKSKYLSRYINIDFGAELEKELKDLIIFCDRKLK